jgi:iron complex transport system substrate-binding protein
VDQRSLRRLVRCSSLLPPLLAIIVVAAGPPRADGARPVTRVATLVPFVAEALARVPGAAVVVASVRSSSVAPPLSGVLDLGSPHAPNLEILTASKPDLVVGDAAMHATMTAALAQGGARVVLVDTGSVEGTFAGLEEVGRLVGAADEMTRAVAESRAGISAARLARPVATLPLFGAPGSFLVITGRTWLGDLLRELGFRNVAETATGKERHPGYVTLSDELVAGYQPSLVLVVAHGDREAIRTALLRRAQEAGPWQGLRDAPLGVHVLDPTRFAANPGLALTDAARTLSGLAQPAAGAP